MKKKLISTLLASVMVIGLIAGCGTGTDKDDTVDNDNTEVVEESTEDVADEVTEVTYSNKQRYYRVKWRNLSLLDQCRLRLFCIQDGYRP